MQKLGLKRHTVKVFPHQDSWHINFEQEKVLILSLKNKHIKGVDHVGSTSIPEMPAKPIIDINLGIDNFYNASKLVKGLSSVGYTFVLEPRKFQWLFVKTVDGIETNYLKVIRYKGKYWNEYENFKNILMTNKKAFEKYKNLKLKLAENTSADRKEYTKGKGNLIKEILGK
jgi:GrpB-like predicted nucleotidyltransferase (UPF0157 family)